MTDRTVDPGAYGRAWAADYDALYERRDDPAVVVGFLSDRVPAGSKVLELGVGTGRLAAPLARAGYAVTGVDASPEMLELLRQRPGAETVEAVQGDFASVDAGAASFDAAVLAFSTLFLVPSQELQLAVLANARRHLAGGGLLAVEAFVPDHSRWTRDQNLALGHLDDTSVTLKLSVHDPVAQRITTQDVTVGPDGTTLRPNTLRYAWPAELDAMALASGLTPAGRWQDWAGTPFTASSTAHVSLYRR